MAVMDTNMKELKKMTSKYALEDEERFEKVYSAKERARSQ